MFENSCSVAGEGLVKGNTVRRAGKDIRELILPVFQRLPAEIEAVELDQVKGAQYGGVVVMGNGGARRPRAPRE
jgi:hypothetical protein